MDNAEDQEIGLLVALFNERRYSDAESLARRIIDGFPHKGFAWKALGVALSSQGRTLESLEPMQRAVRLLPHDAHAHSNLGKILRDLGQREQAEKACRTAISLRPDFAEAYTNLGNVLGDLRRPEQAEEAYRTAVRLKPASAEAHSNLGNVLKDLGRPEEAEKAYRTAIGIRPDLAGTHNNLGNTLKDLGRPEQAEKAYREAIRLKPEYAQAHFNLGNVLKELGRPEKAEEAFRTAIRLKPDFAEAYSNLGDALGGLGRSGEAEDAFRTAIRVKPEYAEAHSNLGNVLKNLGRPEEAEASYRRALEIDPDSAMAHNNLGTALRDLGRLDEAQACYRRALEIQPDCHEARLHHAHLLLSIGKLGEAWPLYESRYRSDTKSHIVIPNLPYPQWAGESLAGKSLLLWPEQGFGDLIQFVRYAPLLKGLGLSRLTIVCPNPLRALFETVEGVDSVVTDPAELSPHDYWSFYLSVPLQLRTDIATIPSSIPYLRPPADRVEFWRGRVPTGSIRVGLVWQGNPQHKNDHNRSLPHLSLLAPLWSVPGVSFLSLQRGRGEEEAGQSPPERPILDFGAEIHDFSDTAAIVAQLDLVVCVDTALAHLAGALGKPCWVLLPALGCDWRWLLERDDSPWYPGVLRLFRQTREGGWEKTIGEVAAALGALATAPRREDAAPETTGPGTDASKDGGIGRLIRLFNDGRYPAAEELARNMTIRFPGNGLAWKILAAALASQGRTLESLEPMQRAATLLPKDAETHFNLGIILKGLGRPELVEQACRTAIGIRPGYAEAYLNLGLALKELGRTQQAEGAYRAAIGIRPEFVEAHCNLGNALMELGQREQAIEAYRTAVRIKPAYAEAHSNLGVALKDLGRLEEAQEAYRSAIRIRPDYAEVHSNLGIVQKELGQPERAVQSYRTAIRIKPEYAEAHSNLGNALMDLGQPEQAEEAYRATIRLKPECAEAHSNLGVALQKLGRPKEAEEAFRTAIRIKPEYADAYSNLGNVLKDLGQPERAEEAYRGAIRLDPECAEAYTSLGNTLKDLGRPEEAEKAHRTAIGIKPDYAEAHSNLGATLQSLGLLDRAEEAFRSALRLKPGYAEAHSNLGNVLKDLGRPAQAEEAYRTAIRIRPGYADAHLNLGVALQELGRLEQAEEAYRIAIRIKPESAEAHSNLGNALKDLGRLEQAEEAYRTALRIKPESVEAYSNLLLAMCYNGCHPPAVQLEEALGYGRMLSKKIPAAFSAWQCPDRARRLRVGLVSGDLRNHPVGYFLENTLSRLDPDRIELIAYPTQHKADALTSRLKPRFSAWKPLVGLSDEKAARLIHADGVQVLIDLSGHSGYNRLPVFARKPAPVQATWLGYWATTGVAEMDYLLADRTGVPPGREGQFSETVWHLPEVRMCFSPVEGAPPVSGLPALRSAGKGPTFGCFQTLPKVNDGTLSLWARVLTALPTARFRWQCKQFDDAGVRADTAGRLSRSGITPGRIELLGKVSRGAYLAAYAEVDVVLDTSPFPGGTTTCEALWMGVPTLTLAGESMLARQGASLLTAAGLAEWIAESEDEFVTRAVSATGTREAISRLAELRSTLRAKVAASPLFDAERFARNLEDALWGMWERRPGRPDREAPSDTRPPGEIPHPCSADTGEDAWNRLLTLFREKRYPDAERLARRMTDRSPGNGYAWKMLAASLAGQGRALESLEPMQRAIRLLPNDAEAHFNLGVALKGLGQLEQAEQAYKTAIGIKPEYVEAHYNLGNVLRHLGLLQEAKRAYEAAIRIEPEYAEAHYNLGVTLHDLGLPAQAEPAFRSAFRIKPLNEKAAYSLGNVLRDHGRREEAEEAYRTAIRLKPEYVEAHSNLGITLKELGRPEQAVQAFTTAIRLDPGCAEAHSNLGIALKELGRPEQAVRAFTTAIRLKPGCAEAHSNLGNALQGLGRLEQAEKAYRSAISLKPDFAEAHSNLGVTLKDLGRPEQAALAFTTAIGIKPDYAEAHSNLGNALQHLGRLEEAEASYRRGLEIKPHFAMAHSNLGTALGDLGRFDEAEASYRRALEIEPDFHDARLHHAHLLLSTGRFREAWPQYECRYAPNMKSPVEKPDLPCRQWGGESLAGKSLLLWPDQGFGDLIQFVRYCPLIKGLGASRLTIVCPSPLRALFETVEGVDAVVTDRAALTEHDYWSFYLSVPLHFRTTVDTIPSAIPYLHPLPTRLEFWQGRLPTGGLRVGLAWQGNPEHVNDHNRSLPHLSLLAPLWSVPGVSFLSLQRGRGEEQARHSPPDRPILDFGEDLRDFSDTAAIVAQLDLVVCVDTAVAHLAGALGKPCWVLLPASGCDWRWLSARDDSPWYPGVLRLFRQTRRGGWKRTIDEVAAALRALQIKPSDTNTHQKGLNP